MRVCTLTSVEMYYITEIITTIERVSGTDVGNYIFHKNLLMFLNSNNPPYADIVVIDNDLDFGLEFGVKCMEIRID